MSKAKSKTSVGPGTKPKTREQRQAEKQTLAMWALLGNSGAAFGGATKPEIAKPERVALERAGLITVEKRDRSYWLEVTDQGWRWAEEHLGESLPDKTYAGAFVLRAWLTRLQAFMQARGIGLAEVLEPQAQPENPNRPSAPNDSKPEWDYATLRERIRAAYLDVTGGRFNARALLKDIRATLKGAPPEAVNDALKRMQREQTVSLMQLDNRVEITEADRAAALRIGNEPRHILWISR